MYSSRKLRTSSLPSLMDSLMCFARGKLDLYLLLSVASWVSTRTAILKSNYFESSVGNWYHHSHKFNPFKTVTSLKKDWLTIEDYHWEGTIEALKTIKGTKIFTQFFFLSTTDYSNNQKILSLSLNIIKMRFTWNTLNNEPMFFFPAISSLNEVASPSRRPAYAAEP